MYLPTIIIFERHWDLIPKQVVQELIPQLADQGYDTLCFETTQESTPEEIVNCLDIQVKKIEELYDQAVRLLKQVNIVSQLSEMSFSPLANLMRLYVSSKHYLEVAEKIIHLPASKLTQTFVNEAMQRHFFLKGIDINEFNKLITCHPLEKLEMVEKNEAYRIQTMIKNLLSLRNNRNGIIFVCGALHAENLIEEFKKHHIAEEVLYYCPHSSRRYDDSIDDIALMTSNNTLKNRSYLLQQGNVKDFAKKIIGELVPKRKYLYEVTNPNSHAAALSTFFANVQLFMSPGYYMDAFIEQDGHNIDAFKQKMDKNSIPFHLTLMNGRSYVVIPSVNTKEIAEKIQRL